MNDREYAYTEDGLHEWRAAVVIVVFPVDVGGLCECVEHDGGVAGPRGLVEQHVGGEPRHVF